MQLRRHYDAFALLGDQVVASYDDAGEQVLDVLDANGTRVDSSSLAIDFAVDEIGGVVAWATADGEVVTRWAEGQLSFGNQGGPVTVAAVLGRAPCRTDGDTCRVFVNNVDGRPPQSVTANGSVTAVAPGAIKVNDVRADGLTAVQLSTSDTGSCSGVYDARRGAYLWRTCANSLLQFSQKGSYLLATEPYLDGLGLGTLSALEARTGDLLATFVIRGGFIAQEMWRTTPTHSSSSRDPTAGRCCGSAWTGLVSGLSDRYRPTRPDTPAAHAAPPLRSTVSVGFPTTGPNCRDRCDPRDRWHSDDRRPRGPSRPRAAHVFGAGHAETDCF